jgi:hypothetical protein
MPRGGEFVSYLLAIHALDLALNTLAARVLGHCDRDHLTPASVRFCFGQTKHSVKVPCVSS